MFSTIAKYTGKLIGETIHQTGELVTGTGNVLSETFDDICDMPSAFSKGYEEEIFETKQHKEPAEPNVSAPYNEPRTLA